jgi:hypothetical protein
MKDDRSPDWKRLVGMLPRGADRDTACARIEAAIRQYRSGADTVAGDSAWAGIAEQADSAKLRKLAKRLRQVGRDEHDPGNPDWPRQLGDALLELRRKAELRAETYKPRSRFERAFSALYDVWELAAGKTSIRAEGPFVEFLREALRPIKLLSREQIKRYISAERQRRKILLRAEGRLAVSTEVVRT